MADLTYVANTGITWTDADGVEHDIAVGDVVPMHVIDAAPWLIEQGHVREAGA